jgi:hypothetical protein
LSGSGGDAEKGSYWERPNPMIVLVETFAAKEARSKCNLLKKIPRLFAAKSKVFQGLKCVLSGNPVLLFTADLSLKGNRCFGDGQWKGGKPCWT